MIEGADVFINHGWWCNVTDVLLKGMCPAI